MSHPEGRSNLALRFTAGKISNTSKVPEGRPPFPVFNAPVSLLVTSSFP
jgi:hypothetical protein